MITFNTEGSPLTIKDLQRAVKHLKSKEYADSIQKQQEAFYGAMNLLRAAHVRGILTDSEYYQLIESTSMNGMLIMSPHHAKLEALNKLDTELQKKNL